MSTKPVTGIKFKQRPDGRTMIETKPAYASVSDKLKRQSSKRVKVVSSANVFTLPRSKIMITTTEELIKELKTWPPETKVFTSAPPFTGVRIIPQINGSVMIASVEAPSSDERTLPRDTQV